MFTTTETYMVSTSDAPAVVRDCREFGAVDIENVGGTTFTTVLAVTWSTHPATTEGAQS